MGDKMSLMFCGGVERVTFQFVAQFDAPLGLLDGIHDKEPY
jgi:hypothetical protein